LIQNSHWGRYNGVVAQGQTAAATTLANGTGNTNPTAKIDPKMRGISRLADGGLDPRPAADSPLFNASLSTPPNGIEAVTYRGAFGATNWAAGWTRLDSAGYFGDLAAGTEPVAISTLPGVTGPAPFRITGDVTLISGVDYLLDETIYVDGGMLTIQPGVLIPATNGASLVVTRGSQIFAEGTAEQPIIFTSQADYDHIKDPVNNPAPEVGDNNQWGGVVVLGSAPVNFYVATNPFTGVAGNTNRGENVIEGIAAGSDGDGDGLGDLIEYGQDNVTAGGGLLTAGTSNPADNSGVIKYVSIRFGGDILGLDNEVNGLTMGGVGSGTVIENVEVFNNTDDGFEWFGGTVNCKNLVSAFNQDEDFDMDEGYSGKIQFAFAIRQDEVDGSNNVENGSELDGGNGSIFTGTPLTAAQVWNATYLGAGRVGSVAAKGNVFRMKDNFAGQFHNCVFDDFGANLIRIDDANTAARVGVELLIQNSHWGRYNGVVAQGQTAAATTLANGTGNTNPSQKINPLIGGISRLPNGGLDPRPNTFSPLYGATLSTPPAGLETVNYRGAFGSTNWAAGWTRLDSAGYFGNLATVPPVNSGSGFADADGDGISDSVEAANTALGFNAAVSDATAVLGTLKTTAQFNDNFTAGQTSVTANPNAFSLYTLSNIQDLSADDIIVQKSGNTATLNIPVESSNNLVPPFTSVGNATLTIPNVPADKQFYRFRIAAP
jgi:hypothetical protein